MSKPWEPGEAGTELTQIGGYYSCMIGYKYSDKYLPMVFPDEMYLITASGLILYLEDLIVKKKKKKVQF